VVVLPASTSDAVLLPLPIPSPSPSPALLSHSACALSRASLPRAAAMAYDGGRDYGGGYDDSYDDRPEFRDGFRDLQPPEPGFDAATYVPDVVKTFVVYLYRHIREKNVYEIHQMYEGSFQKLSDRLFKQSNWPHVDMIAPYVENDHVFCLLYKEMWFRHVYARLQPTLEQRCDSWDNYCNLFQVILHGNVNMQLPNQWLWDMVDEFIYQFQSFCQYRAKLKQKTEHELAVLRQIDEVRPLSPRCTASPR
jgi:translation initiation factor 3 subunit L